MRIKETKCRSYCLENSKIQSSLRCDYSTLSLKSSCLGRWVFQKHFPSRKLGEIWTKYTHSSQQCFVFSRNVVCTKFLSPILWKKFLGKAEEDELAYFIMDKTWFELCIWLDFQGSHPEVNLTLTKDVSHKAKCTLVFWGRWKGSLGRAFWTGITCTVRQLCYLLWHLWDILRLAGVAQQSALEFVQMSK